MSAKSVKKKNMREEYKAVGYAIALTIATYVLLAIAVDRGSLLIYVLAFITLGYAAHFFKKFVIRLFKK